MRLLILILALLVPCFIAASQAAQDDPRLDPLFEQLGEASEPASAQRLERAIWRIWSETADSASARLLRQGNAAMNDRVFAVAAVSFDRLIAREPDFAEAWNRRATLHYLTGNDEASIADIERTLALEPRHFGALSGLGLIMLRNGKHAAALRSFEAALAIHPYLPAALAHRDALREMIEGEPT